MIALPEEVLFWMILLWLFVLGAVIGSFLNVCVYRIPQHPDLKGQLRGLVSPGSHCPKCKTPICKTDNIPILGWLRLKGRCRNCQCKISFRYPLIELLNGLLFVVVYWMELPFDFQTRPDQSCTWSPLGPHIIPEGWSDIQMLHLRYFYHMVLFEALFVASLIDWDTMTIPDASTVPAMVVGVLGAVALGQIFVVPVWFQDPLWVSYAPTFLQDMFGDMVRVPQTFPPGAIKSGQFFEIPVWVQSAPHWHGLAVSLTGFVVGGGLVWGVRWAGAITLKREAMGFGDVILMALVGSFLGWQITVVAFFFAPFLAMIATIISGIGSLFRKNTQSIASLPYGPYLSLSTLLVVLSWREIWPIVGRWFSAGPWVPLLGVALIALLIPGLLMIQLFKRLLGIPLYPEPEEEPWTSADTLTFLAGEVVQRDPQQWANPNEWTGIAAGQGTIHEERWRSQDNATGWSE